MAGGSTDVWKPEFQAAHAGSAAEIIESELGREVQAGRLHCLPNRKCDIDALAGAKDSRVAQHGTQTFEKHVASGCLAEVDQLEDDVRTGRARYAENRIADVDCGSFGIHVDGQRAIGGSVGEDHGQPNQGAGNQGGDYLGDGGLIERPAVGETRDPITDRLHLLMSLCSGMLIGLGLTRAVYADEFDRRVKNGLLAAVGMLMLALSIASTRF